MSDREFDEVEATSAAADLTGHATTARKRMAVAIRLITDAIGEHETNDDGSFDHGRLYDAIRQLATARHELSIQRRDIRRRLAVVDRLAIRDRSAGDALKRAGMKVPE